MARLLLQFDESLDVETLTAADAESIAKEVGVDVGKIEKLKAEWGQPWTLDLVEQALSGSMFVAGVWRQPTMIEAEQAEATAQAAREAWQRAVGYAVALRRSAENAVITQAYKKDPAKFLADREATRRKNAAPAPETAVPGAPAENLASDTPRAMGRTLPAPGFCEGLRPGTPPDIAENVDRGPAPPDLAKMDGDEMLAGKEPAADGKPGWTPEEIAELQRMEKADDKS